MRCERCQGKGEVGVTNLQSIAQARAAIVYGSTPKRQFAPCLDCNGSGIGHCCDGLQACCELSADQVSHVHEIANDIRKNWS